MDYQSYPVHQDVAYFSCDGTSVTSYLKSGYFQKFIDFKLSISHDHVLKLFGKSYPTSSCIWKDMQQLFMDIKRNFFLVKGLALENKNFKNFNIDVNNICIDILKVFNLFSSSLDKKMNDYDCTMVQQIASDRTDDFCNSIIQLIKEMKHLLLFVGRPTSIPGIDKIRNIGGCTSKDAQNLYQYYHLCLDIWYNCTATLFILHHLLPSDYDEIFCDFFEFYKPSPFLQLSSLLVYELSILAINCYNSHTHGNSPFLCPCIKEFWILLMNLTDKLNLKYESLCFWEILLSSIQVIVKSTVSEPINQESSIDSFSVLSNHLHIQNPTEACLWLTSQLAPLYKYNTLGCFCDYQKAKSGYVVAKYLVHNLISCTPETGEKCLRTSLLYCIQFIKLWEPVGSILLPLTDFYIKKIDETFGVQGIELSYLFKDSHSWFNYIQNLSNSLSTGKESSFDHFLCILNVQLNLDTDQPSLWRSLKGRIYSKFIPKKIKEMSEVGLQNSFSLFLIIMLSGELEIVNKICEVASIIETVANPRKQKISWKALYVLLFLCQEKKCRQSEENAEKVTILLSKFFNIACSDYAKINRDNTHRNNLMDLLLVYIDNMSELFKRNEYLNFSEYCLISPGFADLLSACSLTEVNYILSVISTVLQRIKSVTESKKIDFVSDETKSIRFLQLVFNNIYPCIEKIAVMDTAPLHVSDIAGNLTKLTYNFSYLMDCISNDFHQIFLYFAYAETVNSNISCQYLCFILDHPNLVEGMKTKLTDLDTLIFQSWLKCIIYTQAERKCLQKLTLKVLQHSLIMDNFPDKKEINFLTDDPINMAIEFFSFIESTFSKCTSQQKLKIANKFQQYFKKYVFLVENKVRKCKDGPTFSHIYKLSSHLVMYCSTILHFHATSEHILLQILDKIVYPQILFPRDKGMQSLISCSIKEFLPHFMRGLFKLDYRNDKSIEREIRDIFICYIGVFSSVSNPLTRLVVDTVLKREGLTLDAYNFILEVLKGSLLSNNIEKPISIFEFYQEIFRLIPAASKKEISNILLMCAMEIYMRQNDSLTESLKILIKKVLIYFRDKMQLSHTKVILGPIIQWFIQEKLQWAVVRGFSLLDTFVEYVPLVMSDLVPYLTKSVETLEKNRGLGEDILLRNGLQNIVLKLQKKLAEV